VAEESRRWSEGHSRWREAQAAAEAAAAAEVEYLAPVVTLAAPDGSSGAAPPPQQPKPPQQPAQQQPQAGGAPGHAPPRRLAEAGPQRPIRIFVEYQYTDMDPEVKTKLQDTVSVALGVLQKYLRVRRPPADALLAPALCVIFDSAGYCNQFQPDFISPNGGSRKLSMCGLARINGSHIAPYKQCTLGGGSCSEYKGGWRRREGGAH
jgi:hypothetical protein